MLWNWKTTLLARRTASGASVMVATGGVESRLNSETASLSAAGVDPGAGVMRAWNLQARRPGQSESLPSPFETPGAVSRGHGLLLPCCCGGAHL